MPLERKFIFGKYRDRQIEEILAEDMQYVLWVIENNIYGFVDYHGDFVIKLLKTEEYRYDKRNPYREKYKAIK